MRKVFWDNPYQQCLETTVSHVEGNVIVFAETIGFSECGGTHVRSTGEVGAIELKRDRANKGVERIRILLKNNQTTSDPTCG